jgi:hypothetical protein
MDCKNIVHLPVFSSRAPNLLSCDALGTPVHPRVATFVNQMSPLMHVFLFPINGSLIEIF